MMIHENERKSKGFCEGAFAFGKERWTEGGTYMIIPAFLQKGDKIGVTACSDGRSEALDVVRMHHGISKMRAEGFHVETTPNVWMGQKGRSASAKERAEFFMSLVKKPDVKMVWQTCGGDYLCEMLSYVDYDVIAKNPKWHQGFSDPTGLLYGITTNCDMVTVYGGNFSDMGMEPWHGSLKKNLKLLTGEGYGAGTCCQRSYDLYQKGFVDKVTGLEPFQLNEKVVWKAYSGYKWTRERVAFSGRQLGGCLDVCVNLVGTRHDGTKKFLRKHSGEGVVWVFESFATSSAGLTRTLWQLREAGWFEQAKGFVFGRPVFFTEEYGTSYEEAVLEAIGDLRLPILFGADFGHCPPRMTLFLGAKSEWSCQNGAGEVVQHLE